MHLHRRKEAQIARVVSPEHHGILIDFVRIFGTVRFQLVQPTIRIYHRQQGKDSIPRIRAFAAPCFKNQSLKPAVPSSRACLICHDKIMPKFFRAPRTIALGPKTEKGISNCGPGQCPFSTKYNRIKGRQTDFLPDPQPFKPASTREVFKRQKFPFFESRSSPSVSPICIVR